jgi:hypothetical protein
MNLHKATPHNCSPQAKIEPARKVKGPSPARSGWCRETGTLPPGDGAVALPRLQFLLHGIMTS